MRKEALKRKEVTAGLLLLACLTSAASAQYSCLVVLPDGDLGVLYEDALKSKLTFARFGLDWLTGTNDIKNQP